MSKCDVSGIEVFGMNFVQLRDAYNQRSCNQPIDFDYYKITAPDSD